MKPEEFYEPSEAELKARKKRNVAIALLLVGFMIFIVFTIVSRGVVMTPGKNF